MKKPDAVLRELGQLYDFQKELVKFRFRKKRESNKAVAPAPEAAPLRSPIPDR